MRCPFCGNLGSRVADSRAMDDNRAIKRRRICDNCGAKFTTYERLELLPLTVKKRDGTRESFDRDKILTGILRSCNKRNITRAEMQGIVDEIETYFQNQMRAEISSNEIGELVMEKLKNIDEVSYVRFASVYKQFKDIDTFMEELSKIQGEKGDDQEK